MQPRGLILEGVTGAGKSSTLAALARCAARPPWLEAARVVTEEETLGELMSEDLQDPSRSVAERVARLTRILALVSGAPPGAPAFLLERFHLSYYALQPDWAPYVAMDADLAERGFRQVLLTIPEAEIRRRSLHRVDRAEEAWARGMIEYFGSEALALEALLASRSRRLDCCAWTRLPTLILDTSAMAWDEVALRIAEFCVD
jgi:chloramphenicol 3-O-phosphotransferase